MEDIKVGDIFKGKINGAIFKITTIDKKNGVIFYKCNDKECSYGLHAFKHCLLDKIN